MKFDDHGDHAPLSIKQKAQTNFISFYGSCSASVCTFIKN